MTRAAPRATASSREFAIHSGRRVVSTQIRSARFRLPSITFGHMVHRGRDQGARARYGLMAGGSLRRCTRSHTSRRALGTCGNNPQAVPQPWLELPADRGAGVSRRASGTDPTLSVPHAEPMNERPTFESPMLRIVARHRGEHCPARRERAYRHTVRSALKRPPPPRSSGHAALGAGRGTLLRLIATETPRRVPVRT